MSDSHKEALAEGRSQGRAIRNYLEALDAYKPKRGRKRTPDSVQRRLDALNERLSTGQLAVMDRLSALTEREQLVVELGSLNAHSNLAEHEAAFVEHAASYSSRKGVSYSAWREIGVPADVLRRAGISRSS